MPFPRASSAQACCGSIRSATASRFPLSIILLAGRVGVGSVFFKARLLKYNSPESRPSARSRHGGADRHGSGTHDTNPALLGLATRVATLPLLGMILMIQTFVYPNAYQDHLVWDSILVLVLTRGPGVFSLDYPIERLVVRRTAAPAKVA